MVFITTYPWSQHALMILGFDRHHHYETFMQAERFQQVSLRRYSSSISYTRMLPCCMRQSHVEEFGAYLIRC